jgi:DNA (cytosine-5)-methyltransferase 1
MRYLSVCSGIEAATVAWHPLGWEAAAYSEIEKFPSQVLAHHYPNTPNVGDMTKFKEWINVSDVNVLVGGTPCQSFSVAGLRKGLDDPRGNLMLTYLAIAAKYRPKWLVWENVPGVLSSNGGLDFASLLRGMGELGYGFAYRVLDAQYFGVAQRRRRVFVVGYAGNWRPAAAVLFERHSMCGYPAPSREKGQATTRSARTGAANSSWPAEISSTLDTTFGTKQGLEDQHVNAGCPMFVPAISSCLETQVGGLRQPCTQAYVVTHPLTASMSTPLGNGGKDAFITAVQPIALAENTIGRKPENGGNHDGFTENGPMYTLNATGVHGVAQPIPLNSMNCFRSPDADASTGCGIGEAGEAMFTITKTNSHAVAQPIAFSGRMSNPQTDVDIMQTLQATNPMAVCLGGQHPNAGIGIDQSPTLTNAMGAGGGHVPITNAMQVRRLTPVECERLQGFPDNYTDIKLKGKPTPDGPRYKALGNSMAVPVMAWIGKRIQEVEAINAP